MSQVVVRAYDELGKIVELFESQELPTVCAKALIDAPSKPSSQWSLGNIVLMLLAGTKDARGYRQWQEAGRYVVKGAKCFYILGPVIVKKKVIDEETNEEKEEAHLVGFKSIPVFRYEDTDGKPLEEYKPKELPPLMDVAEKWSLKVKYERLKGAYGEFDSSQITLATEEWSTFFHELAHGAHARIENLKPGQDPEQEAIAQLTAATLSRMYGRNNDNWSWNYIAGYAGQRNPEAVGRLCFRVLAKVQKVISLILETVGSGMKVRTREDSVKRCSECGLVHQPRKSPGPIHTLYECICGFRRVFPCYIITDEIIQRIKEADEHARSLGCQTGHRDGWHYDDVDPRIKKLVVQALG